MYKMAGLREQREAACAEAATAIQQQNTTNARIAAEAAHNAALEVEWDLRAQLNHAQNTIEE